MIYAAAAALAGLANQYRPGASLLPSMSDLRLVSATVAMAVLAFLIATRFRSILEVLGLSSEIMAEGLFVPGMAMIWLRGRRPLAGVLSLALGGGFAVAGSLSAIGVLPLRLPPWPESVPCGILLSLAGFVAGGGLDALCLRRRRGLN